MLILRCFKAGKGDSFLLTWKKDELHRLLIDSGIEGTYRFIGPLVRDFGKNDYVIMTHVDYDHIGGLMKWLSDEQQPFNIETLLYINTPQLLITTDSTDQVAVEHGVDLEKLLKSKGIVPNPLFMQIDGDNVLDLGGLKLQILSPSREVIMKLLKEWTANKVYQEYIKTQLEQDEKVSTGRDQNWKSKEEILKKLPKPHEWEKDLLNSSSIAFIMTINRAKLLFMGDANPDLIADELSRCGWSEENKLPLKLFKISHHGSKHNTTKRLLEMIECSEYLISTDSSGPYYHPSRETLILLSEYGRKDSMRPIIIYSNYPLPVDKLLTEEERINITFEEIDELKISINDQHGTFEQDYGAIDEE
ncbi:ComEC/Rec2 family competence protein [Chryseobacterium indologenes]|nr:MBL fold metallo-hydrolase [Chryseobacterium indologenes]ASE61837.1 hypothetical protein CEQ15_10245 [Chryseobacterium indologenes]VFA41407.1 DNA internalization-related competence protein ComEC/Rec2 [Chryseobacterium indologenes]